MTALREPRRGAGVGVLLENSLVTPSEGAALLTQLHAHCEPHGADPGVPWAAVVLRGDGSFVLAASTMLTAGVFWSVESLNGQEHVIAGTDLGAVVRLRQTRVELDPEWVAQFAVGSEDPRATPYTGVRRLPPGCAVVADATGQPRLVRWAQNAWGPAELDLPAAVRSYRELFAQTVDRLTHDTAEVPVAMSAGLDSTYVAAVAATIRNVRAYVSSPLPGLVGNPSSHAVADDLPAAHLMRDRYPGRLTVEAVRNIRRVAPLEAAARASDQSWWPVPAPENWVWMAEIARRVTVTGSPRLLVGSHGNRAFSGYWPRTTPFPVTRRLLRRARTALARRIGFGTRDAGAAGSAANAVTFAPGWEHPAPDPRPFATGFRDGLAMRKLTATALLNTGLFAGRLALVDPFTAPAVLSLAARISPQAWGCEPAPRGFARQVGAGLVPDPIRLRQQRGAQAPDSWLWINDQRRPYLDQVQTLADTPVLQDMIDIDHLRARMTDWPWNAPVGPPKPELNRVHRVLALADFVRMTTERLKRLPASRQGDLATPGLASPIAGRFNTTTSPAFGRWRHDRKEPFHARRRDPLG